MCEKLTRDQFAELLKERSVPERQIPHDLKTLDDIKVLSDGRKPVYLIELNPEADAEDINLIHAACIASNIVAMILPAGLIEVKAEVE